MLYRLYIPEIERVVRDAVERKAEVGGELEHLPPEAVLLLVLVLDVLRLLKAGEDLELLHAGLEGLHRLAEAEYLLK